MSLESLFARTTLSQRTGAEMLGISAAALNAILKRGQWPVKNAVNLKREFVGLLVDHAAILRAEALKAVTGTRAKTTNIKKENTMLINKQTLLPKTKRLFNIRRDPFSLDLQKDDVYISDAFRYVRESMLDVAKSIGIMAVIGESGSGKSTIRRAFKQKVKDEDLPIKVIEPYVLGAEDNDKTGKTLRALHIAEAILFTVAPSQKCQSSPEARFRQVHKVLRESYKAGWKHCLVIEEAHDLSFPTLKHLKRFYELEEGYDRLLSIILVGQTELKDKLSTANSEIRELAQRIETVDMPVVEDLQGFISHRLERVGLEFNKLFTPDALDVLTIKLVGNKDQNGEAQSHMFPLAIGNTLIAALNTAAEVGENIVTGDIIRRI